MNPLRRQPDPAAEEQASLWAARLEGGTLSAADRDALDAWLNADASHRPLLSSYCQFSTDLEEQLLSLVATGGVTLPPEPEQESVAEFDAAPPARRRRWGFPHLAGIALAAAAAAAVVFWVSRPAPRLETVATATAQRSTVTLSDGSRVELNARTSFTFQNGAHERRLQFASGEAFFTVAKDPARPFIIATPAGSVRVTGTVFNVRQDAPATLEVTVVEGSVQVRPGDAAATLTGEPYALTANACLSAVGGTVRTRTLDQTELDAVLAWRQGQVVFKDVPLWDVLKRLADYHGKAIYPSAAVEQSKQLVGTRYNIDDLGGTLDALGQSFGLQIEHESNGTIRVKLNAEH
jgi:transmembrane sensor